MINLPKLKHVCLCATSNGVPRRSLYVAVVVGTILNLINQGEAILSAGSVNWLKAALTYLVPYAVCTYGAVCARLEQVNTRATGDLRPWSS